MRALVIASALFSVLLFIVSGALARVADPAVAVVGPSRQTNAVRLADRACTAPQSAAARRGSTPASETPRSAQIIRLPKPAP
jgi:hypothetical protein